MRAKVGKMVGDHARSANPSFRSDQGDVWDEIEAKQQRAAFRSPTAALHELYEREEVDLEKVVAAFPMPEGVSGLAVGIGGRLVAVDLFDSTETLRKQWRRLIASGASARLDHNRRVVAGLLPKSEHRYPDQPLPMRNFNRSAGEGWDVRLATTKLHGSALVRAGRVVHLALFHNNG